MLILTMLGIGGPLDAVLVSPKDGHTPFSQRDVQSGGGTGGWGQKWRRRMENCSIFCTESANTCK
jgi:hypothetical protein